MALLEMAGPAKRLPQILVVMKPCVVRAAVQSLHECIEGQING
jgi:hypothetical protein